MADTEFLNPKSWLERLADELLSALDQVFSGNIKNPRPIATLAAFAGSLALAYGIVKVVFGVVVGLQFYEFSMGVHFGIVGSIAIYASKLIDRENSK